VNGKHHKIRVSLFLFGAGNQKGKKVVFGAISSIV
jgi:hypothetical protein